MSVGGRSRVSIAELRIRVSSRFGGVKMERKESSDENREGLVSLERSEGRHSWIALIYDVPN